MVPGFHGLDLIVILVIALLIFGPKKLPEMGSAIGKSIKEFRKGMNELTSPKGDEPKSQTPTSYEALERELASKREAASRRTDGSETSPINEEHTESKAE
jgi:sec-independent protein translocase protein TatA